MSFVVGSIAIGSVAAIAGGAFGAKGSKDAAKIAKEGSLEEIEFNRESRDLARADQAPYREAGYTALDALLSLTGLKGTGSSSGTPGNIQEPGVRAVDPNDYLAGLSVGGRPGSRSRNGNFNIAPRADGGSLHGGEWGVGSRPRPGDYRAAPRPGPRIEDRNLYGSPRGEKLVGSNRPAPVPQNPDAYRVGEEGPESVYRDGSRVRTHAETILPPDPTGYVQPNENPGGVEGGYNFMTDPGYEFRFNEGQRMLERRAAAAGGLLSGGFARRAMRYGQDYASNEYTNVYNRIANIAGIGTAAANASGNAALYSGARMGNAASQGAVSSAYGQQGATNAWANAANQIGQLPWERIWRPGTGDGGGGSTYGYDIG